jgi:hypothetical protein
MWKSLTRHGVALLWLLLLLSDTAAQGTPPACQHNSSAYDALACWLSRLELALPDQSFHEGIIRLSVENMTCSSFELNNLQSSYTPTSLITVRIAEIMTQCTAEYYAVGMSGSLVATAGTRPQQDSKLQALKWTVAVLDSNHTNFPDTVRTADCATALAVVDLNFTGSISAKLVDRFRHSIASYVSTQLNQQVCPQLKLQIDPLLTHGLEQLKDMLEPYWKNQTTTKALREITHDKETVLNSKRTLSTNKQSSLTNPLLLFNTAHHLRSADDPGPTSLVASDSTSLVNQAPLLINLFSTINQLVTRFLQHGLLQTWFPTMPCQENCGFIFSGINGFIRAASHGRISISLPTNTIIISLLNLDAQLELSITNISLTGFDQWDAVKILDLTDKGTFESMLSTNHSISLCLDVTVNISSTDGGVLAGEPFQESFQVNVSASSLYILLDLAVGLEPVEWKNLTAGDIIEVLQSWIAGSTDSRQIQCTLRAFRSIKVQKLIANIRISGVSFVLNSEFVSRLLGGRLESDVYLLLNNVIKLVLNEYQPLVTNIIANLVHGPLRDWINDQLRQILRPHDVACPQSPSDELYPHFVNFTQVVPLQQLNTLLKEPNTLTQLNGYLDCTAAFLSRAIRDTFSVPTISNSTTSLFEIQLTDFQLKNVGSVRHVEVIRPDMDGMSLESGIGFGLGEILSSTLMQRPQLVAEVKWNFRPLNLSAVLNITVAVDQFELEVDSVIQYDLNFLKRLLIAQLLSHGSCIVRPVSEVNLYGIDGHLGYFGIIVNGSVVKDKNALFVSFDSMKYPAIGSFVIEGLAWFLDTTRDAASDLVRSWRAIADDSCTARSETRQSDNGTSNMSAILLTICMFILLAQPIMLLIPRPEGARSDRSGEGQNIEVDDLVHPLLSDQPPDAVLYEPLPDAETGTRLMDGPALSDFVRFAVPVLIVGTITLLLSSNLSVGATVDLTASVEGTFISLPPLFSFSLLNTARDMFNARIYPLLVLVVLFRYVFFYCMFCRIF